MSAVIGAFVIGLAFLTSVLSGVLGMAGGLVLMGGLAMVLTVSTAFVTHGLIQFVANGWRAILHRKHVQWRIVWVYAVGALAAGVAVGLIAWQPSKPWLYLALGLVPLLTWLPQTWITLDASRRPQALVCGVIVTAVNLTAGVAGPLLDIFFVRTTLTRHAIVATKAATQTFAHMAKVIVYGAPLLITHQHGMPPWWVFALAIPASMLGTVVGGWILDRLDDVNFKRWTRWIVTFVGIAYLAQAAQLFSRH